MYWWRITKYDPRNRNELGHYMKNEWTEYCDIGKIYEDKLITTDEYLRYENKYVEAVNLFIDYLNIIQIRVLSLQKHFSKFDKNYTPSMISLRNKLRNNQLIDKQDIPDLIRLLLRRDFWCILECDSLKIDVSSDFYMYIGCIKPTLKVLDAIQESGLFVEKSVSPLVTEDEEPEFH